MGIILWIVKAYVVYKVYEIMIEKEYLPLVVMPVAVHCTLLLVDQLFWMMPYKKIFPLVVSVHSFVNTWTFLVFGITAWVIIEYLYVKYVPVRIFVNIYRKRFFSVFIFVLIVNFYVTIVEYNKDDFGVCLPLDPYDYFMYSYRLKARYRFWKNFYDVFLASGVILTLSICFYFLLIPISIA